MIEEKNHVLSNKHLHLPNAWRAMFWKKMRSHPPAILKYHYWIVDQTKVRSKPRKNLPTRGDSIGCFLHKGPILSRDTNQWLISQNTALASRGIRDNLSWDKSEWLRPKNMNFDWPPQPYSYIEVVVWTFIGPGQKEVINLGIFQMHSEEHHVGGLQQSKETPDAGASCFQMAF